MFQAMRASGVVPMVRVPWLDPAAIMKVLDSGALGIICPIVNTPAQAVEFISYMYYPPLSERSFGRARSLLAHGADYYANANAQTLLCAMVKTAKQAYYAPYIAAPRPTPNKQSTGVLPWSRWQVTRCFSPKALHKALTNSAA